ncbi:YkgJ family cysteine cluster protein [Candidatus Woesearchaeota archaeon]|nr:YkgJ family cysteine cluster protein [Candidatus Woesearchaeota archaeon]
MFAPSNFKCDRYCGKCCRDVFVKVTKKDIERIKKLGYKEEDFLQRDFVDSNSFVLKHKEKEWCFFLEKGKNGMFSCRIHGSRPDTCRIYPFFDRKPIKSCYPEDLLPDAMFSFRAGRFLEKKV